MSGNRGCDDEGVTEALGHQHLERKEAEKLNRSEE